jgi:hypothetical protein
MSSNYLVYIKGDREINTDTEDWKETPRDKYFACKYTGDNVIEKVVKPSGNNINDEDKQTLQTFVAKTVTDDYEIIMKFGTEKKDDVFKGDILFPNNDKRTFTYDGTELKIVKAADVDSETIVQQEPELEAPVEELKSLNTILQELTKEDGIQSSDSSTVVESKDQTSEQPERSKGWAKVRTAISDGKLQQLDSPELGSAESVNQSGSPASSAEEINGGKRKTKSKRSSKKKRNTKKKRKTQNKKKSRKRSKK